MIAIGVDWEGRRNVLAVELASRESLSSWKEFGLRLKSRGLNGTASIKQVNDNTLTEERSMKAGKYHAVVRNVISKDGKTMTSTIAR